MEKNKGNVNLGKQFVERRKNELEWNEMRGMMHHLMNSISNQLVVFSSILWDPSMMKNLFFDLNAN